MGPYVSAGKSLSKQVLLAGADGSLGAEEASPADAEDSQAHVYAAKQAPSELPPGNATASSAEASGLRAPDLHSPESAQRLRHKYNRLFEMAESAPEGSDAESGHGHGVTDSLLNAHGHDSSSEHTASQPQAQLSAGATASGTGSNPRGDTHLSLTEMLLLEEDSLAESKATPLLQHRVSMASNIADVFPASPSSSASPLQSERSMLGSPDFPRGPDTANSQQAETSQQGGWPGPAPEWISVVMRGKHKDREAFIQYHVPEELVYVNGTNLTLKVSALSASCHIAPSGLAPS